MKLVNTDSQFKRINLLRHSFLLSLLVNFWTVASVNAASFDCALATSRIDNAICASPIVSKLDSELDAAYKDALTKNSDPNAVKVAQRAWLRDTRNQCQDDACFVTIYKQRIAALGSTAIEPETKLDTNARADISNKTSPYLIDKTATLTSEEAVLIKGQLDKLSRSNVTVAAFVIDSTGGESIATYTDRLGNEWKEAPGHARPQIIIAIAKDDHKVRISVNDDMRNAFSDQEAKAIISEVMIPKLKSNNFGQALLLGLERMDTVYAQFKTNTNQAAVAETAAQAQKLTEQTATSTQAKILATQAATDAAAKQSSPNLAQVFLRITGVAAAVTMLVLVAVWFWSRRRHGTVDDMQNQHSLADATPIAMEPKVTRTKEKQNAQPHIAGQLAKTLATLFIQLSLCLLVAYGGYLLLTDSVQQPLNRTNGLKAGPIASPVIKPIPLFGGLFEGLALGQSVSSLPVGFVLRPRTKTDDEIESWLKTPWTQVYVKKIQSVSAAQLGIAPRNIYAGFDANGRLRLLTAEMGNNTKFEEDVQFIQKAVGKKGENIEGTDSGIEWEREIDGLVVTVNFVLYPGRMEYTEKVDFNEIDTASRQKSRAEGQRKTKEWNYKELQKFKNSATADLGDSVKQLRTAYDNFSSACRQEFGQSTLQGLQMFSNRHRVWGDDELRNYQSRDRARSYLVGLQRAGCA